MKLMITKIMVLMSMMCIFMKTPMSLGMMLMSQTFLSSMLMITMNKSPLHAMIMFIIMIGGLMVIFMYMSSITSNKKFKFNQKSLILITILLMPIDNLISDLQMNDPIHINMETNDLTLSLMYNKTMSLTMMMTLYLIITMFSINKIIKQFEGPMRSNTYE